MGIGKDFIFSLMTQYIQSGESVIISSPAKRRSIDYAGQFYFGKFLTLR
jgi:hypothetical protein